MKTKKIKAWKVRCYGYDSASTIYKRKSDAMAAFKLAIANEHPVELIPIESKPTKKQKRKL